MKLSAVLRSLFAVLVIVSALASTVVLADGPVLPAGSEVQAPAAVAGTAAAPAPAQQGFSLSMFLPFAAMFAVFYFFMIRPQQKKVKDHQAMLSTLNYGDEVVTNSGILGKVAGIADKVVILEVADNVKMKFLKGQVSQVVKGPIKDLNPSV